MRQNLLVITGTGIKSISHLTVENISLIEQANMVYYLINEPLLAQWIKEKSKNSESLDWLYFINRLRVDSYKQIAAYVISQSERFTNVCLAIYGHPTLLSDTVSYILKSIDRNKLSIYIAPGISSFDCLLADLEIDPYSGCFCTEANEFLYKDIRINPDVHLILWQIGLINDSHTIPKKNNVSTILALKEKLLNFYDENYPCVLYEASLYPHIPSKIIKFSLTELDKQNISRVTTLYVPPKRME